MLARVRWMAFCATIVLALAPFRPAWAQSENSTDHTITVTGEADVHAEPDMATVTVGVTSVASTADEAMGTVSQQLAAVIAGAKALGIESRDIQTTGLSLQPVYRQRGPNDDTPPQIQAYRASNNVSIIVRDLSMASSVLDSAINNGANVIGGISFGLSDTDAWRRQALTLATQNARAKAEAIAVAEGVRLGELLSVTEQSTTVPIPRTYAAFGAAPMAAQPS